MHTLRRSATLALLLAARLGAQGGSPGVRVQVHVSDTARAPVAGAEATLERATAPAISLRTADTVWTVEVILPPLALWLAPIVVKDRSLPRARQPYLDSTEIT